MQANKRLTQSVELRVFVDCWLLKLRRNLSTRPPHCFPREPGGVRWGSAHLPLTEFLQWAQRVAVQRLSDYKTVLWWQLRLGSVASTPVTAGGGRGRKKKTKQTLTANWKLDFNSILGNLIMYQFNIIQKFTLKNNRGEEEVQFCLCVFNVVADLVFLNSFIHVAILQNEPSTVIQY